MKPVIKQSNKKAAFTIVELLTVMSIIVILIGLLVPSLNMAKRYAKKVRQAAQFHSIDAAIELFNNEYDGYPPSDAMDGAPPGNKEPYCGAMKLCEAMMGQDLMGFHPNSRFIRTGEISPGGRNLYVPETLNARKGTYLPLESANAYMLQDIYDTDVDPFLPASRVLCDVYTREQRSGMKTGMPILYYKADTANNLHIYSDAITPFDSQGNIYNYWDNHLLVGLGKPWEVGLTRHKLFSDPDAAPPEDEGKRFYWNTRNEKITTAKRPYRADSYILISAGYDGEYGTVDDICNFEWKYQESLP